jgi:TolB-like protein
MIAAALSVAIVVMAAGLAFNQDRGPAEASTAPGVAVLPFEHYSTEARGAKLVAQVMDLVTVELARRGTLSVASRTSAASYGRGPESVPAIAKALQVDFIVEGSVVFTGEQLHLVVRLVDGHRDRKVWVGEYDTRAAQIPAAARRIAADLEAAVMR